MSMTTTSGSSDEQANAEEQSGGKRWHTGRKHERGDGAVIAGLDPRV